MTQKQEQIYVDIQATKLDIKVKRLFARILKEVLGAVRGFKSIFIPTRSKMENLFKLWVIGLMFSSILIILLIIRG